MNAKLKKFLKRTAIVTTGVLAFGGTLVGGYLIVPNRTKFIDISVKEREATPFEKFVSKVTSDIGMAPSSEEESVPTYMSATFENLNLNYKFGDSTKVNNISIGGGLDFRMSDLSMSGIELNLVANVDYNGRKLDLTLGHFNNQLYLNLNNTLRIKAADLSKQHLIEMVGPVFATEGYLNFAKMYRDLDTLLTDKIAGLVDGLLSGDSGMTSSLDLGSLSTKEERTSTGWEFTLSVGEDIKLKLLSKEDFTLYRVEIEKLEVSSLSVSGAINIELKNYEDFVSPVDEEYVEVLNYSGLYSKLASLLNENNQKVGVEFAADLSSKDELSTTEIAVIKGSLNVDFDALLDLSQYTYEMPENLEPNSLKRDPSNEEENEKESSFVKDFIEKCGFNLQLDLIGQQNKEYANLDLAFIGGEGYLRFNEQTDPNTKALKSVMKLKLDTDTMNYIMEKIPSVISNLSGDESNKSVDKLMDFLSDDLASAISDGDFSFILDMIDDISNDSESINIGLDLSSLGIGDSAKVNFKLDGTLSENEKIPAINLDVNNVEFGNFSLNAKVNTSDFSDVELGSLDAYQSVTFLPDVIDQVSDLVKAPKSGFVINGSVLGEKDNLGIKFSGAGKFDNSDDVKAGYGNMTIYEYKYNANKEWATHLLNVDIENKDSNIVDGKNNNQALFIYGDPNANNVKGKLTLQTFVDLVDIFKTFYGDAKSDPKFTKFLAPITELLGVSTLSNIIQEQDYLRLASNELLQEVSILENGSGLKVVVSGTLLGLDSDMTLKVLFEGDDSNNNHKIKSINIENFKLGKEDKRKVINVSIELQDYDFESYTNIKGETKTLRNEIAAHRNESYMNLDGIKTLLSLGINTTRLNYYRLTADAGIKATVIGIDIPVDLNGIDFHIYVDGVTVKVYGKLNSVPLVVYASEDHTLLSDKTMSAEFSFETYENSDDEVGGIFNIKRIVKDPESEVEFNWFNTKIKYYDAMTYYHYQCDSKNFLDNIVYYLLGGMIGLKTNICDAILGSSSSSEETEASDFTQAFTSTGFQVNGNTIKLGLNLDVLTGVEALREAEITLTGASTPTGNGDEYIDVLSNLDAKLRIHYAVDINLTLNATMKECAFSHDAALAKWNANANANFVNLTSVTLSSAYFNNPTNPKITKTEENVHY